MQALATSNQALATSVSDLVDNLGNGDGSGSEGGGGRSDEIVALLTSIDDSLS